MYVVEFYDHKNNRAFSYINVLEVDFRIDRVLFKCKENNGNIFKTYVTPDEYDEIKIERVEGK